MTYKEMVQALFRRSGMSVKDYAEAVGYSVPQVSNVINENQPGSLKLVQACLKHAGIDIQACLELPEKAAEQGGEQNLLRQYRKLSDGRKKIVLDTVKVWAAAERVLNRHKTPRQPAGSKTES